MGGRRRDEFEIEGHEFTGWVPANELTEEDRELVRVLSEQRVYDRRTQDVVDQRLKTVEGDLIPTCECGWRGQPDDWFPVSSRSRLTGTQHINHKHSAQLERIQHKYAAKMAASALGHAADAWDGDPDVAMWLRARTDHILDVGYYDGEEWPS